MNLKSHNENLSRDLNEIFRNTRQDIYCYIPEFQLMNILK
jgi:hypothetical protein